MRVLLKRVGEFDIGTAPLCWTITVLLAIAAGVLYAIDMRSSVGLITLGGLAILVLQRFLRSNKRATTLSVTIAVAVTIGIAAYTELRQYQQEKNERHDLSAYTSRFFADIMCNRSPEPLPHYELLQDEHSREWLNRYVYLQHKLDALNEYLLSTRLSGNEKRVILTAIQYSQYDAKVSDYTGMKWYPTNYGYYEELMERFVIVGLLDSTAVDCDASWPVLR